MACNSREIAAEKEIHSKAKCLGRGDFGKIHTMNTVMVSPEFQVVIPLEVRQALDIHPGQEVQVIQYDNRVELISLRPIHEARGLLTGIDTTIEREPDRI